jgi:hypothetical protein
LLPQGVPFIALVQAVVLVSFWQLWHGLTGLVSPGL